MTIVFRIASIRADCERFSVNAYCWRMQVSADVNARQSAEVPRAFLVFNVITRRERVGTMQLKCN